MCFYIKVNEILRLSPLSHKPPICYTINMKREHLIPLGKGKKIIYLEPRGRTQKQRMAWDRIWSHIFAAVGILCLLYCLTIFFFMGYGTSFFLIWGIIAVCCGGMALILRRRSWLDKLPKWFKRSFVILCCIGGAVFLLVEGLILSEFGAKAENNADYVIVLGAQWKSHGPSYVLQKRLDKAVDYLLENPETLVIVTGGQGSNEQITEAEGMYGYLVEAGIAAERIYQEDQATNTVENLVFSGDFLDRENDRVVLVTNNFHMFRALSIAKGQGYENVEGLAAGSYPGMLPNNLLREFFGVGKDFLVGNF